MRETALRQTWLIRLLLLMWLAASCASTVHAADHATEAAQHECVACLLSPDLAAPAGAPLERMPSAPAAAQAIAHTCAAMGSTPRPQHARAPPTTS